MFYVVFVRDQSLIGRVLFVTATSGIFIVLFTIVAIIILILNNIIIEHAAKEAKTN